jgi:hypothetical protein
MTERGKQLKSRQKAEDGRQRTNSHHLPAKKIMDSHLTVSLPRTRVVGVVIITMIMLTTTVVGVVIITMIMRTTTVVGEVIITMIIMRQCIMLRGGGLTLNEKKNIGIGDTIVIGIVVTINSIIK